MAENTNAPAEAKPEVIIPEVQEIIDYFLEHVTVDGLPMSYGNEDAELPDVRFELDSARAQAFILSRIKAMFERAVTLEATKQTRLTDEAQARNKQKAEDEAEEIPDDEIKGED